MKSRFQSRYGFILCFITYRILHIIYYIKLNHAYILFCNVVFWSIQLSILLATSIGRTQRGVVPIFYWAKNLIIRYEYIVVWKLVNYEYIVLCIQHWPCYYVHIAGSGPWIYICTLGLIYLVLYSWFLRVYFVTFKNMLILNYHGVYIFWIWIDYNGICIYIIFGIWITFGIWIKTNIYWYF